MTTSACRRAGSLTSLNNSIHIGFSQLLNDQYYADDLARSDR
ncbi:hypothetical protein BN8_03172 [Fibrisoma limi BUZ 3]|uniref:Uncharacterized protein n=1 Tax=Fibrisoma limi BUZ 3 TaxID=1185876 RepID=I2GJF7_9BACT|nr:hypothetical protein BN8_03172 [Fibrisoma limi BUZ 3]